MISQNRNILNYFRDELQKTGKYNNEIYLNPAVKLVNFKIENIFKEE